VKVALVVLALLAAAAVGLQAVHERRGGVPAANTPSMLYVRSPEAMKRLALSYDALLADVYWIRAVQHYGSTRLSTGTKKSYDLLYPLLDLTTSLDPRFNVAYLFGSLFLAEPAPGGPGRPDLAIALLEKGLRTQPDKWELAQAIGFVHYWWREDYVQAAEWFRRAAEMPGGPFWLTSMAAVTLAEGGRRDSSRVLWEELARSELDWFRNEAQRRLRQLDAMDQIDQLQTAADAFERRFGRPVGEWDDLRRAGYLRGVPRDPTGTPYTVRAGRVAVDRASRLYPMPAQSARSSR
jgi:tetratricopeptide (TPR) repeat protein